MQRLVEKRKVADDQDNDIIALARHHDACVQIFFVRSGKLIGREYFILEGTDEETNEHSARIIKQFYSQAAYIPDKILLEQVSPHHQSG